MSTNATSGAIPLRANSFRWMVALGVIATFGFWERWGIGEPQRCRQSYGRETVEAGGSRVALTGHRLSPGRFSRAVWRRPGELPSAARFASVASTQEAADAFVPLRDGCPPIRRTARSSSRSWSASYRSRGDGSPPFRPHVTSSSPLIDMGDLKEATVQLARLDTLPPGSTNDLAEIARAKLLRSTASPARRSIRVRALVGKLVDPCRARSSTRRSPSTPSRRSASTRRSRTWTPGSATRSEEDHGTRQEGRGHRRPREGARRRPRERPPRDAHRPRVGLRPRDPAARHRAPRRGGAGARRLGPRALARLGESSALGRRRGRLGELATTKRGLVKHRRPHDRPRAPHRLDRSARRGRGDHAAGVAWALDLPRSGVFTPPSLVISFSYTGSLSSRCCLFSFR